VYGDAERLLYGGDQVRSWIGGDGPLDECHDLLRQLVSSSRSPLLRHQRTQPTARERRLSLIEGRTRKTKELRCLFHREVVAANATQHFVFHLKEVVRIEEVAVGEQLVGHPVWPRIERARLAEGLALWRAVCATRHV